MSKAVSPIPETTTREEIAELGRKSGEFLDHLRTESIKLRGGDMRRIPQYSISRAAKLVGRSEAAIRDAENEGRLPPHDRDQSGRRINYTLADLNNMRRYFKTMPWRSEGDEPGIIAVQNFKGGVGKSTVSVHLAQYLAIQGYRVLLIDCDSQASSTLYFGHFPDLDFADNETLLSYIEAPRGLESLEVMRSLIKKTHIDGLDLIPSNLHLYTGEYYIASLIHQSPEALDTLYLGVRDVARSYDFVILDPPPALGTISMAVMRAANSLLIPVPPSISDLSSTATFFKLLEDAMRIMEEHNIMVDYKWIKLLMSRANETKSIPAGIMKKMRDIYGFRLCNSIIRDSATIDNASATMMSIYELPKEMTNNATYKRCLEQMDAIGKEVEMLVTSSWKTRKEGSIPDTLSNI